MTAEHWYGAVDVERLAAARRTADRLQRPQMVHEHPRGDEWHADGTETLLECTDACRGLLPAPAPPLVRVDGPPPTMIERARPYLAGLARIVAGG